MDSVNRKSKPKSNFSVNRIHITVSHTLTGSAQALNPLHDKLNQSGAKAGNYINIFVLGINFQLIFKVGSVSNYPFERFDFFGFSDLEIVNGYSVNRNSNSNSKIRKSNFWLTKTQIEN